MIWFLLATSLAAAPSFRAEGGDIALTRVAPRIDNPGCVRFQEQRFDLASSVDRQRLRDRLNRAIEHSDTLREERKRLREGLTTTIPLAELPDARLREYFDVRADRDIAYDKTGLRMALQELRQFEEAPRNAARSGAQMLREILAALENAHRPPVPRSMGGIAVLRKFYDHLHRPLGIGKKGAANLGDADPSSNADPLPGAFWRRPDNIASQDLVAGFGRVRIPNYELGLANYTGPKRSYGTQAGVNVEIGDRPYKIKFGEVHSEPFTARIFHALGYHVEPSDYAPSIMLRYDRRILREFNLRQPLTLKFTAFGHPFFKIEFQPYRDPFAHFAAARLKDGTRLQMPEFKRRLLRDPRRKKPEKDPHNYDSSFESQIAFLETGPVNVQPIDRSAKSIGPWDFNQLDHPDHRELRGLAVVAAWVAWDDTRFPNTRLKRVTADGEERWECRLTDVGGGMGKGTGLLVRHGESAREFRPIFTRGGPNQRFRITGYSPIMRNDAFREMTPADARWAASLIRELTENQLTDALRASGYSEEDVHVYRTRLLERRSRLLPDLQISNR